MEFRLFDAGGAQIAVDTNNAVSVTAGVFTVNLNFLSTAFQGADRFLQISVRRNKGEAFVTLSPRQQIASSPYSIRALSAAQADTALDSNQLGGVPANQYVTGGSGTTNTVPLWTGSTTLANSVIMQSATGDVDIGTNNPGGKLNVVTDDGFGVFARVGGQPSVGQGGGVGVYGECASCNVGVAGASNSGMGVKGFSITNNGVFGSSAGGVGVLGTTSGTGIAVQASGPFVGTGGASITGINGDGAVITARRSGGDAFVIIDSTTVSQNSVLAFRKNNLNRWLMFADSPEFGGNVGSNFRLDAYDDAGGGIATHLFVERLRGFVGIGTTAPERRLHVNGRARIGSIPPEASVASVCFNAVGDLLQCTSSLRFKTDVQPFLGGLDIVRRLKPISFNWKDGSGHAADSVKYDSVGVVLINAVKEQQEQIESQQKAIEDQRKQIDNLIKIVCRLESKAGICPQ